jgi:1-acyl-sn-glycerol-3-phosphate acyltransferase
LPARLLFATRRIGHKRLPKKGAVILASNHVSNIDPVLVVLSMRRPIFHLAKHTLFKNWFTRGFFEYLGGQISVDRDRGGNEAAFEAGKAVLARGLALGIYPEGVRSYDGLLTAGRTGVARLALLTGSPIYPVAIDGTFRVWPRGQRFPRLFRRTRVIVGDPIPVERDEQAAGDPRRLRELTDRVMYALAGLLGQPDPPKSVDPSRAGKP